MKHSINYFLSILLLINVTCIFGQKPDSKIKYLSTNKVLPQRKPTFERISKKEGLSQSTVNYIIKDRKGFMWFATYDGINKYDGYTFTVYRNIVNDKTSLVHNGILYLYEDIDGYIWIVNNGNEGLNIFDPESEKFIRYKHNPEDTTSISSDEIYHVMQDISGNIWICTKNALNLVIREKVNDITAISFKRFYNLSDTHPFTISYIERNGKLLLFADFLYYFDYKTNKIIKTNTLLKGSQIISICEDKSGNLWLGTLDKGISKLIYNQETGSYNNKPLNKVNVTPNNRNFVLIDAKDRIWIGTESKGLYQYIEEDDRLINFSANENDLNSISDNTIYSLFIDSNGILWIGTFSKGLCKYIFNQKQFKHFKSVPGNINSLGGNVISSIHSTKPGELWVGSDLDGGVSRFIFKNYNEPKVIRYRHDSKNSNSIGSNSVVSLVQRKNGDVWVGSNAGFLSKIIPERPGTNERPVIKTYSFNNWTFSILEDKLGILWGGTWENGLWRYNDDSDKFTFFRNEADNPLSICDNIVWTLFEDNAGNIWIGGHGGGISILPEKETRKITPEFINFKHEDENTSSLINNTIHVFCQDYTGTIWIGTAGGLSKVMREGNNFRNINANDKLKFYSYSKKDGLPNENITGIVEDNSGNLWISTSNGLSKFNIKKGSFKNFDERDGLQSSEFWHNAYFKDYNGIIYFGGPNGFNAFYPDSIKDNPYIPNVVITDFLIFNKPVEINAPDSLLKKHINLTDKLVLSYNMAVFSFKYAALNYVLPEKNQYAYMMQGFEKEWNFVGNKREATYTNLNPGKYIFKVKASNNDGIWNEKGVSIEIIILPPWWKTWWFRLLIITLIICTIVGFIYYRMARIRNINIKLRKLVVERTKVIELKNKALIEQSEILNETNTLLEERQQRIEEQAEELMTQKEELVRINDELQAMNATKDKFFTIIAHDLKNPFNAIMGFSELLSVNFNKYDDTKKSTLINTILESSRKLYKLLENLLQWARSQTGSIEFNPEEFYIYELVDSNTVFVENMLVEKNIKIIISDFKDIKVYADRNMISTVIRNLITNAIKFNENGTISVDCEQNNSLAKLKIKDTGIGIPPDKLENLFDIATSKSTQGTRGEGGTGLGLILCKEFILKNKGNIGVESEVGKGSTFYFTLPADSDK